MRCYATRRWTRKAIRHCAIALLAACASGGCLTTTYYVPAGDPVKFRKPVKAHVWVECEPGEWRASKMVIPAGWYALPDPGPGE